MSQNNPYPLQPRQPIPKFYKWELLILLWFAYFLNQGDRAIFGAVLPLIKADTGFTDVQLGWIGTLFMICYAICVPIAGYAGDVFKRGNVVFGSLLVFSTGTLLTGFAGGFIMLVIYRSIATGIGEAFYYPSASTLIGQYHQKTRATAIAIHQTSLYTGIVCSSMLAAWIGTNWGWRSSFYFFGSIGVLLAFIILFRLRDDKADAAAASSASDEKSKETIPVGDAVRHALSKPTLYCISLALGGMMFTNIGFLMWMPTYMHEKFELSLFRANFDSMFYHHICAYFGLMIAATLADYLAPKRKTVRMEFKFLGLFLAVPFIFLMGQANNLWIVYLALCGFGIFRGVYDSNLFVAVFDIIEPKYRSTAMGLMLLPAVIIAAFSSVLLGWIKQNYDLQLGITALSCVYLLSASSILFALMFTFKKDYYAETPTE
ncbi:MAG: MFS transporter [Planctomycetaceae bacterium]|nr:MFS transporter [Planctomycetaceae bacterium]